jgi:mannose-1-phosphate guanylyltransferase
LLLAAGLGTRLRPITYSTPKCLVEIAGRPLLDYWIELLSGAGITDILINMHHLREKVDEYLDRCTYPVRVTRVFEGVLLGTAGTLLKNRGFFEGGPVMLIHADNLSLFDVRAFIQRFHQRPVGVEITMMTFMTDTPSECGILAVDDKGVVMQFYEKVNQPPGRLANAAVYIVAPTVVDFIVALRKQVVDFSTDVLPHYLGRINTFHNDVYHRDIGTVKSLLLARRQYPRLGQ